MIWATVPQIVDSMATTDAILADQQVAAQFKAIRAYYTENVVNKVVRGGAFQANIDHQRSETVIPLPATFLRELGTALNDKDTTVDLVSPFPFPARKDRKLDDFQQQAWSYLTAHPDETFAQSEVRDGKHIVRVAVADTHVRPILRRLPQFRRRDPRRPTGSSATCAACSMSHPSSTPSSPMGRRSAG